MRDIFDQGQVNRGAVSWRFVSDILGSFVIHQFGNEISGGNFRYGAEDLYVGLKKAQMISRQL